MVHQFKMLISTIQNLRHIVLQSNNQNSLSLGSLNTSGPYSNSTVCLVLISVSAKRSHIRILILLHAWQGSSFCGDHCCRNISTMAQPSQLELELQVDEFECKPRIQYYLPHTQKLNLQF